MQKVQIDENGGIHCHTRLCCPPESLHLIFYPKASAGAIYQGDRRLGQWDSESGVDTAGGLSTCYTALLAIGDLDGSVFLRWRTDLPQDGRLTLAFAMRASKVITSFLEAAYGNETFAHSVHRLTALPAGTSGQYVPQRVIDDRVQYYRDRTH